MPTDPTVPAEAPPSTAERPLASQWPVEKLVAILEAEPWLLHRRVECVNVGCEAGGWCVGCDPWGEAPCSENPWPCALVREKNPAFAAGRAQAAADIRAERARWERLGYDDSGAWVAAVRVAEGRAKVVGDQSEDAEDARSQLENRRPEPGNLIP
jgi:hypothetical protein